MKKFLIFFILLLIVILGASWFLFFKNSDKIKNGDKRGNMKIESSAFQPNQRIPSKYTCDGENINPQLLFSDVPKEAKSLVLIMDDPDAPMGNWTHWTLWNISPQTKEIPENFVPAEAVEGKTSFGRPGYGGPCPPSGTHRYFFKLYALDKILDLPFGAERKDLERAMEGHILEKTELIGLYGR
jgi:Raf kinase inhibitor-like YbhB/YbcL family protein